MVFDELRRIGLSVLQPAHVLDAIEKDQLATLVEPDRVAGLIALLRGAKLFSGSLVVQVAEKAGARRRSCPPSSTHTSIGAAMVGSEGISWPMVTGSAAPRRWVETRPSSVEP